MENELRSSFRFTIEALRKSFELERSSTSLGYARIYSKLQGIHLLLSGMDGVNDLIAEVDKFCDEIDVAGMESRN